MDLNALAQRIAGFPDLTHPEKITAFGWWIHRHGAKERFTLADIRNCYDALSMVQPKNFSVQMTRLSERRPPHLLRDSLGFRLEQRVRSELDARLATQGHRLEVAKLLADLPGRVSSRAESTFLSEALTCYQNGAFRAAIVMTWNLAYDHFLAWLLSDTVRLASFNARISIRFPSKAGMVITKREDFDDLKESEVIQIASSAGLISKNTAQVLQEKLTRRNAAAHPSLVEITQYQAEDVITDLVNNVVLTFQ